MNNSAEQESQPVVGGSNKKKPFVGTNAPTSPKDGDKAEKEPIKKKESAPQEKIVFSDKHSLSDYILGK